MDTLEKANDLMTKVTKWGKVSRSKARIICTLFTNEISESFNDTAIPEAEIKKLKMYWHNVYQDVQKIK